MLDYASMMTPDAFQFVPEVVNDERDTPYHPWFEYAVDLHALVAEQVEYYRSGKTIPDPEDMLDLLQGDCQDQSVLLGTLYTAAGLSFRFVRVQKGDTQQTHVLIELRDPVSDEGLVCDLLRDYYRDVYGRDIGRISYDVDSNGEAWLISDPGWSDYVGDAESLRDSPYCEETSDGWRWYNLKNYQNCKNTIK